MKKTIPLLLLIILSSFLCQANPDSIDIYTLDAVDELLLQSYVEAKPLQQNAMAIRDGFLKKAWDGVTSVFKPVWGEYNEEGHRSNGPYTVFQHHKGNISEQVVAIRQKIMSSTDTSFFRLYAEIYKIAKNGSTDNCTDKESTCPSSQTAKCAAFVYIIGLYYIDANNNSNIDPLADDMAFITNSTTRNEFGMSALVIVQNAQAPGLNNWADQLSSGMPIGVSTAINFFNGIAFKSLYRRSRELINLLQAFDMVRWGSYIDGTLYDYSHEDFTRTCAAMLTTNYIVPMYRKLVSFGWANHNNHTIMSASALGMAAVAFNDYGTYLLNLEKRPKRWANVGNFIIQKIMWTDGLWNPILNNASGAMSSPENQYGFSEGTHYTKSTFELLLPYMLAQYNYQDGNYINTYHNYPLNLISITPPRQMRTMYKDQGYDNILKWYKKLVLPNGQALPVDESWADQRFSGALAIKNKTEDGEFLCNITSTDQAVLGLNLDVYLVPDYLAAQPTIVPYQNTGSQTPDGTSIIKDAAPDAGQQAFHALLSSAEHGVAKNSFWHQQNVPGHITLVADNNFLLIDPAKPGEGDFDNNDDDDYGEIMRFKNHNIIYHGWELEEDVYHQYYNHKGNYDVSVTNFTPINYGHTISIFTFNDDSRISAGATDYRTIKRYKGEGYYYYLVDDLSFLHHTNNTYNQVRFNGNSETYYSQTGYSAKWDYSCQKTEPTDKWALMVETGATGGVTYATDVNIHGAFFHNATLEKLTPIGNYEWGMHSTFTATSDDDEVRFLSKLTPYRCNNNNSFTTVVNMDDYTMLLTKIVYQGDTIRNFHAGLDPNNTALTTIGPVKMLGGTAFLSMADNYAFKSSGCLTFTQFRKAEIDGGSLLEYNDTVYLWTNLPVNIYYELQRKFKYNGFAKSGIGQQVLIYMPDLERYYPMVARDAKTLELLPSTHSDTSATLYKYINVTFPAGTTEFILELANPCLMSCFFPPTASTIDSIFDFNTGSTETLGHDLDIVQDSGELRITNGSKMSICPDYYLFNRDSIVMHSNDAETIENYALYAPEVDLPGGGTGIADTNYLKRFGSSRSMIIVNNNAALILDSGSYTHVGAGATILVRKGGTLLVQKHATLEIGSNNLNGYGEVIAEAGAYICIEDSSDLHFFVTEQDTNDRNIFFMPTDKGVVEGVNQSAIQGDFSAGNGGRFDEGYGCLPLCSLWYHLPDYGVNNPDFGYNSVGKPVAQFKLPADTMCTFNSDTIYIDAKRSLNEAKYRITATRVGLADSVYFRQQEADYQRLTHREMIDLTSLGTYPGTLNITVVVENTCGDTDYIQKSIFIPEAPTVSFTLSADTLCQGYGSLVANGSVSTSGTDSITHLWSVVLIDTFNYSQMDTNRLYYGGDWQYTSIAVSDSFTFPDFKWIGGARYAVGLKVMGLCNNEVEYWDTVTVPLQAWITATALKSTHQNLGTNTSIVLQGNIAGGYDSYTWSTSGGTLLYDNTLTPELQSTDTTTFVVLTATKNTCSVTDTITLKHRNFINLGEDEVVCHGDEKLIGNRFEGSLLLGILAAIDQSTYYSIITNIDSDFEGPPATYMNDILYINYYTAYSAFNTCPTQLAQFIQSMGSAFYNTPGYDMVQHYYTSMDLDDYMNYFVNTFLANNPSLQSLITAHYITYETEYINDFNTCLGALFASGANDNVTATWYKNNTELTTQANRMLIWETITATTNYGLLVNNNGYIEYDEVNYIIEDTITPMYDISYVTDSTIYFSNFTQGANPNTTSYLWSFGDGTTSILINPSHTFPAMDSSYIVCLSVNHTCGIEQFCDTITIDTILSGFFGKRGSTNEKLNWTTPEVKQATQKLNNKNLLGNNKPNPFTGNTQIDYELAPNYNSAKLVITNTLGQTVQTINIPNLKGAITIDGTLLNRGMYYYALVVNNTIVANKIMVVK